MAAQAAMLLIIITLTAPSTCRSVVTPTPAGEQSWLCPDEGPCTSTSATPEEAGTAQAPPSRSMNPEERSGTHAPVNPSVPLVDDSQFDVASLFPIALSPQHTLLDGAQTARGALLVVEDKTKGWRLLMTGGSILGGQWLDTDQPIFSSFMVMSAARFARPTAKSYLSIGLGIGSAVKAIQSAERKVDVVEISKEVVDLAKKHFDCSPNGKVHIRDALDFYQVRSKNVKKKYDVILQDTFDGTGVDARLIAKETLAKVRKLLHDNGLFVFNFVGFVRGTRREMAATLSVRATLQSKFAHVRAYLDFGINDSKESALRNIVFFASDSPISFFLPPEIIATGMNQDKDPNLVYNHFQEWEVTTWTSLPDRESRRRKHTNLSAAEEEDQVISLRKADLFTTKQKIIKDSYMKQIKSFVPAEIWNIAQTGLM